VTGILDERLGPVWRTAATDVREQLDEVAACSLALGYRMFAKSSEQQIHNR
jgi:hypothetical protein